MLPDDYIRKMKQDLAEASMMRNRRSRMPYGARLAACIPVSAIRKIMEAR